MTIEFEVFSVYLKARAIAATIVIITLHHEHERENFSSQYIES